MRYLSIIILSLFFFACGNESTPVNSTETKTPPPPPPVTADINGNAPSVSLEDAYGIKPTGTTASGYEYVMHSDEGGENIKEGEVAYFRYYIKKRDSIMSSSNDNGLGKFKVPSQEEINQRKPSPVLEGIMTMSKGDSLTVYYPASSLPRPVPELGNEPFLLYTLSLVDIKSEADYLADQEKEKAKMEARADKVGKDVAVTAADYKAGKLNSKIKTTSSGLKYIIHEAGTGKKPAVGNTVSVDYYGVLTDGQMFDNSFKRGQSFNFPLGQGRVIKGWDEGIALLKEGSKATLFVPYELGYGEAGSPPNIPAKAELIFYVELQKVL